MEIDDSYQCGDQKSMTDKNGGESRQDFLGDVWLAMSGSGFGDDPWRAFSFLTSSFPSTFDLGRIGLDLTVGVNSSDNMPHH